MVTSPPTGRRPTATESATNDRAPTGANTATWDGTSPSTTSRNFSARSSQRVARRSRATAPRVRRRAIRAGVAPASAAKEQHSPALPPSMHLSSRDHGRPATGRAIAIACRERRALESDASPSASMRQRRYGSVGLLGRCRLSSEAIVSGAFARCGRRLPSSRTRSELAQRFTVDRCSCSMRERRCESPAGGRLLTRGGDWA
jgi:hypothetical protein